MVPAHQKDAIKESIIFSAACMACLLGPALGNSNKKGRIERILFARDYLLDKMERLWPGYFKLPADSMGTPSDESAFSALETALLAFDSLKSFSPGKTQGPYLKGRLAADSPVNFQAYMGLVEFRSMPPAYPYYFLALTQAGNQLRAMYLSLG